MKRLAIILGAILVPLFSAHFLPAAGFFKVGEKAPSFALNAISGEPVSLDAYKGKVVVLGLFHICDPCMMQGTNLQKVYEATQGKNVAVVGVNSSGNSKKEVGEFLSAFPVKVTYPYLLDPGKVTDKLYGGGKFKGSSAGSASATWNWLGRTPSSQRWTSYWRPEAARCREQVLSREGIA